MKRTYEISLEISGPHAMWARPDTAAAPVSYPIPPESAVKGVFESILMHKSSVVVPTKVEICRPVIYSRWVTNYGGPLRKSDQIRKGASYQLFATILNDVCYRLYGRVDFCSDYRGTTNPAHAYQEQFLRRLRQGRSFRVPCLGWSEFMPDYVGPFRDSTEVVNVDLKIPSLLRAVFDKPRSGAISPVFSQDVEVRSGVLRYAE